jgi:hypothetical protein
MAVVQISRIQVRRGQAQQGTGLPQLASGELGWAVDTQELYIGNGSVSEGAPAVGNTQILTDKSDIFSVIGETYAYKSTDPSITTGMDSNHPVKRSLQDRLDDRVNAASFGVIPDTNATAQLQNALLQLFPSDINNTNVTSRVTLELSAGVYNLTDTIYVPSNVTLVGAGKGKTIINSSANPVFQIINSYDGISGAQVSIDWSNSTTEVTGAGLTTTTSVNQPKDIILKNFSLKTTLLNVTCILADAVRNLTIDGVSFDGLWTNVQSFNPLQATINFTAISPETTVNNRIINCDFTSFGYAVISSYDLSNSLFENCNFRTLSRAIVFGEQVLSVAGSTTGPINNTIYNCKFENISKEAVYVFKGSNNISKHNTYILCGNNMSTEVNQAYNVIKFDTKDNSSVDDWFSRSITSKEVVTYASVAYKAEVAGAGHHTQRRNHDSLVIENLSYTSKIDLIRVPADSNRTVIIDYAYRSKASDAQRSGQFKLSINIENGTVNLTDDCEVNGFTAFDTITKLPKLRFYARYVSSLQTAVITFTNQLDERQGATYDGADFNYKLTYVN